MRRRCSPRSCVLVLLATSLCPAVASAADPFDLSGAHARGDFDDDGEWDVVASSPETNCGKGAIYVAMGSGTVETWTEDTSGILGTASCDDNFGASLVVGDFNGDDYDDLAIGTPGDDEAGPSASGSVHVIYGSASGLTATGDQLWNQDTSGILGTSEADDFMGDALTTGDFDCDGYDDLAIGVPRENNDGPPGPIDDSGAVNVIFGSSSGLGTVNSIWYQGTGGVDGELGQDDYFGAALAAGNIDGDTSGSYACDDLAIGTPGEDRSGSVTDSGFVYVMYGTTSGLSTTGDQGIDQDVADVEDSAQTDDQFGFALEFVNLDGDSYDDLTVTVLGDACTGTAGRGEHVFFGSSSGLSYSDDYVACDTFGCDIDSSDYGCLEPSSMVHASSAADTIYLQFLHDVAFGYDGADVVTASLGNDVLFGGAGADTFDGGSGVDLLIGGSGDDAFWMDLDCEISAGDVVDGGPGTDTVYSHLSEAQLGAAGVILVSIENFVSVSEDDADRHYACDGFYAEPGAVKPTDVTLSWDELPSDTTIVTSTTGVLHLDIENEIFEPRTVTVRYFLYVGGTVYVIEESPTVLSSRDDTTLALDLSDFIPSGVDPETVDPSLLDISGSARLVAVAEIADSGETIESAYAPTLYGHAHDDETLKIYRKGARDSTYFHGNLAMLRGGVSQTAPYSGRLQAWGQTP